MVMETPPSPQCVGREFVRQYYTLLNEAPAHLHRFYNNSSSFIHGGLDPPNRETTLVVGQKQIHQKIQQLNFRDCHAKITQVDSQATLGNGVVVQVTGELSNGGQPMRRFTQTFVLAFQAPKKYYVHNDIFRYQDMLTEDEYEEMSRSEIEVEDPLIQQQNTLHSKTTLTLPLVEDEREDWSSQPMVNGTSETHDEPVTSPQQHQPMHAQAVPVVPVSPQQLMNTSPSTPVTSVAPQQQLPVAVQQHSVQPLVPHQEQDVSVTSTTHHHHTMIDKEDDPYRNQAEPEAQQIAASPQNSTGDSGVGEVVKTYANLVKGSSASVTSSSSTAGGAYYSPAPPPPAPTSPTGGMGRLDRPKPQRTYRTEEQPINMNNDSASFEVDRGRKPHYSDSQQLFMGNLPHYATEMELKEIFGKFGNIVDLRVLSKPGSKGPGGRVPPNYGFIIFEQASSVQAVLSAKPIIYPDDSGTKLNVEEKKTKVGGGGVGGGGGGGGGSGGGRGGRGGGRGSLLGPPGRGGPRPGPPPSSSLTSRQNFHRR